MLPFEPRSNRIAGAVAVVVAALLATPASAAMATGDDAEGSERIEFPILHTLVPDGPAAAPTADSVADLAIGSGSDPVAGPTGGPDLGWELRRELRETDPDGDLVFARLLVEAARSETASTRPGDETPHDELSTAGDALLAADRRVYDGAHTTTLNDVFATHLPTHRPGTHATDGEGSGGIDRIIGGIRSTPPLRPARPGRTRPSADPADLASPERGARSVPAASNALASGTITVRLGVPGPQTIRSVGLITPTARTLPIALEACTQRARRLCAPEDQQGWRRIHTATLQTFTTDVAPFDATHLRLVAPSDVDPASLADTRLVAFAEHIALPDGRSRVEPRVARGGATRTTP